MKKNGWKGFCKKLYKYRVFLLMLAPAVIYTLIFSYYSFLASIPVPLLF